MIRRWSCVIELMNDFESSNYTKKRFKFRLFRLNVRFRRFNLKKTKFKRKSLMHFKRQANWYLYFNIIRSWSKDFKFIKKISKYQYLYNIFPQNCVLFDPNFFNFNSDHFLYDFSGKIVSVNKLYYYYFHKTNFKYSTSSNIILGSSIDDFTNEMNVVPFWGFYDFTSYKVFSNREESVNCPVSFSKLNLYLFKISEIKKFLNILIFLTLNDLFLELISFRKKIFKSSASRNSTFFYFKLNYQKKYPKLTFFTKNKSGRGENGKIIIRTKTSLLQKRRSIQINYILNYTKLSFIGGFLFVPYRNKLLSLFFYSNGAVTYYLTTINQKIFFCSNFLFQKRYRKLRLKKVFSLIFRIKKLSFLSYLAIKPMVKAQYVRSSGCKSRLFKFDKEKHLVVMELPSDSRKMFSYYSTAFLGRIANRFHKNFYSGKAGYWRSFGSKSIVRGVAKNPVDHPHGGRTKAIKHQRTPWGKTTKLK